MPSLARDKPSWARRIGYLAGFFAVLVAINGVLDERSYARMAETAVRVEARIVRVEQVHVGGRHKPTHVVHYEIAHGGNRKTFSDEHGTSKLRDFYLGSPDVFAGPEPQVAVGKTIALLVNPYGLEDHRADRDELPQRWMLWVDKWLSVGLLASISAVSFWLARGHARERATVEPKKS
jgi:hypothetical protein